MLKYHSQNEDPRTTAKRLEQLCVSLQTRLFKQVSQEQLESSILGYLNALGNQLPVKQMLARKLAEYFRENWPRIDAKTLEQLVQRRPEELDHLLGSIDSEDLAAFTEKILPFLRTKPRRKKPADKAEGQRNINLAKNRYDRNRRYRPTGAGLIEIQFGKNALSPAPIRYLPPTCLDELFQGGEVKMAGGGLQHCLEDLLGIDRHKMPKKLPSVRRGRQRFYNLHSLLQCLRRLLTDTKSKQRWLPDPGMRLVVLFGIIERAEAVAPQRVHVEVIDVLMPFCLASSRVLKQQGRSASKLRS